MLIFCSLLDNQDAYVCVVGLLAEDMTIVLQEEEAKAQKAREEEAAALEFEKWKGEFSIDAEGTTENEVQDGHQDLLSDFVEYIKVVFSSVPVTVIPRYCSLLLQLPLECFHWVGIKNRDENGLMIYGY